jgi:hypothetical protein
MRISTLFSALIFSTATLPAIAGDVTYSVQQTAFDYVSITTTSKVDGGSESKFKNNLMSTMPNSLVISATVENKMAFYLYPTQPGMAFGAGYFLMPNLEAGLNLKVETSKDDAGKSSALDVGPYLTFYHELGSLQLEGYAMANMTSSKNDPETPTEENAKFEDSGYNAALGAMLLMPISKTFLYGFGFMASSDTGEDKEAKVKSTETTLAVQLAAFRANF